MKASELMERLQSILDDEGDVEIDCIDVDTLAICEIVSIDNEGTLNIRLVQ